MPSVDLIDETFVAASPARVAARVADPAQWRAWWPNRRLEVFMDRGERGIRWSITGDLVGSAEIWLEPVLDGTLVHYFVRAEPPDGAPKGGSATAQGRRGARLRAREARAWKLHAWALKDDLESGRQPGAPAGGPAADPGTTVKSAG
jgi:hypothetical protein